MSHETSKAMRRRLCEDALDLHPFKWRHIFTGSGIDVGCGPDPLPFHDCVHFDEPNGDANFLTKYFAPCSFDYLHSSQSLEHMHNPDVLWDWLTLLRPGGHAIITVPSWELFENMRWPSRFNPDHKSTWSINLRGSPAPFHIHVPSWLDAHRHLATPLLVRQLDCNYDYRVGDTMDQTWIEANGVEVWIEYLLRRLQP